MSIFSEQTEEEKAKSKAFFGNVKNQIKVEAFRKSVHYCYNFELDEPMENNTTPRFLWNYDEAAKQMRPSVTSFRSSLSTLATLEHDCPQLPNIEMPDFQLNSEGPELDIAVEGSIASLPEGEDEVQTRRRAGTGPR